MITVEIDKGAISAALEEERVALAKRVRLATNQAGRDLLIDPLRAMTREALNSAKLPTTWRGNIFPKEERHTLTPAFFAFSKAPLIMQAFENGAEIKARSGKYLAIPTIEAGRNARHGSRGRLTPEKWVKENKVALIFRPTSYGGVLIAELQRFRTGKRKGKKTRSVVARRDKPQVMFILLKQVRLRKRLDLQGLADRAGATYRATYERAANNS